MKKIISFLIVCLLLCGNVFASSEYRIVDMSEFEEYDYFAEGMCAVQDNVSKRWGFVDINKNWVIEPQYRSASYFTNGLCAVNTVDGESVLINKKGDIVFKRSEFYGSINSENFYVKKHDKYNIVFDGLTNCNITLLDESYNTITPSNVALSTFRTSTDESPERSETVFWENDQKKVYNYKGVDISSKLIEENIKLSNGMIANNKYIVGRANEKIKCFDINGNKIAEFDDDTFSKIYLRNDVLISNNCVYNIKNNSKVFNGQEYKIKEIQAYYNKFYTVKKDAGTSALYSIDGSTLVDFGKWDYIFPLSASNHIVVSSNGKYGLANYEGELLTQLEYTIAGEYTSKGGKYAVLRKDVNRYAYIDPITQNTHYNSSAYFNTGYKYHKVGNNILNENLNIVYSDESINYVGKTHIDTGIVKQQFKGKSGFVILNDSGIKVELDNLRLEFDVLPIIQNGRTLVPMRAIFEALGADVEWNGETQTITATNKNVTIQMQIGNNTLTKNGQNTQMDVCPQLVNGRTMVPVRAVSDSFNVTVGWDGYTQTVSLFTN